MRFLPRRAKEQEETIGKHLISIQACLAWCSHKNAAKFKLSSAEHEESVAV
jgi:hypothetical protein